MRILIDIGHPAHVHLFRNFAMEMINDGHRIIFTTRDKDQTLTLLNNYKLPFISLGKPSTNLLGKVIKMLDFEMKLFRVARDFKPDVLLSHGSVYAAHVSFLMRKPHVSFEDTGNMEQIILYKPFTKAILVSDSFTKSFGNKTVVYSGYHELAYLHPNRFVPDPQILELYNLDPNKNLIMVRFVAWKATHDVNHRGIPPHLKSKSVETFHKYGQVLISSESVLPEHLRKYQIKINPIHIFDIMAKCRVVFGESATMASEAAVLGVPAIYIDSVSRDYTLEQERKYGLVYNFREEPEEIEQATRKTVDILKNPVSASLYSDKRRKLLRDKIDVTGFLKRFILNYESL